MRVLIDMDKLRKAVRSFAFHARPSSANDATPCTVGDLNEVIADVRKVLEAFIDEIEADQSR